MNPCCVDQLRSTLQDFWQLRKATDFFGGFGRLEGNLLLAETALCSLQMVQEGCEGTFWEISATALIPFLSREGLLLAETMEECVEGSFKTLAIRRGKLCPLQQQRKKTFEGSFCEISATTFDLVSQREA